MADQVSSDVAGLFHLLSYRTVHVDVNSAISFEDLWKRLAVSKVTQLPSNSTRCVEQMESGRLPKRVYWSDAEG